MRTIANMRRFAYDPFTMSLLPLLQRYLGSCAAKTLRRERPLIIAITGSVGKSSAKQAIAALLAAKEKLGEARVTKKNYNNELGIPLTVFDKPAPGRSIGAWFALVWNAWFFARGMRKTGVKTFVFEMGADKPGDLAYLASIAPPNISVITGIAPSAHQVVPVHAANYPTIDAVADEKATLIKTVTKGGTIILNADDKRVFAMRHLTSERVLTYGEADGTDVQLIGTRVMMREGSYGQIPVGLEVQVRVKNSNHTIVLSGVYGKPMAYAVCVAVAVGEAMGLDAEAITNLSTHFRPLNGRTRIIRGIKYTTLLDDTYNASPAAVLSSLQDLASLTLRSSQRRVACLGEMRELGEQSEAMHRLVGAEAAKLKLDLLLAVGPFANAMAEGAKANGMTDAQIRIVEDTPEAGLFIQKWMKPGDIILAKASEGTVTSKGVRMERVIKELMEEPQRAGELLVRQEERWKRR